MEAVGVGRRAVAIIIDTILLMIVGWIIAKFTGGATSEGFEVKGAPAGLLLLIALAYYIVMEVQWGGTLGKLAVRLTVVKENGEKLDWQASIVRNVLRIIDGFFFYLVGAIVVWTSKKRQRLGDMAAHTLVVPRILALFAIAAAACLQPPEAAAAETRYKDIVMSDSQGGKDVHTFKPATPKIFIHANLENGSSAKVLKGEWIAVKTQVAPPNYKIDSVELKTFPLITSVDFNMSKPNAGWPEGDYRVDLLIDGKKATEVKFKVVK